VPLNVNKWNSAVKFQKDFGKFCICLSLMLMLLGVSQVLLLGVDFCQGKDKLLVCADENGVVATG
jgi:hypothetical protein